MGELYVCEFSAGRIVPRSFILARYSARDIFCACPGDMFGGQLMTDTSMQDSMALRKR